MPPFEDLTGKKYGRWIVCERAPDHVTKGGLRVTCWKCKCECGVEKVVHGSSLKSGRSSSCGCYSFEQKQKRLSARNKENAKFGGASKDDLFRIWKAVLRRCYSPKDKCYHDYGGRGICVCEEWKSDYFAFKRWAESSGYKNNLSIERIDNDGNYEPSNCRWATPKEQANNRRSNHLVNGFGETKNIGQWAEALNVPYNNLYNNLQRHDWSLEKVVRDIMKISYPL